MKATYLRSWMSWILLLGLFMGAVESFDRWHRSLGPPDRYGADCLIGFAGFCIAVALLGSRAFLSLMGMRPRLAVFRSAFLTLLVAATIFYLEMNCR